MIGAEYDRSETAVVAAQAKDEVGQTVDPSHIPVVQRPAGDDRRNDCGRRHVPSIAARERVARMPREGVHTAHTIDREHVAPHGIERHTVEVAQRIEFEMPQIPAEKGGIVARHVAHVAAAVARIDPPHAIRQVVLMSEHDPARGAAVESFEQSGRGGIGLAVAQ